MLFLILACAVVFFGTLALAVGTYTYAEQRRFTPREYRARMSACEIFGLIAVALASVAAALT